MNKKIIISLLLISGNTVLKGYVLTPTMITQEKAWENKIKSDAQNALNILKRDIMQANTLSESINSELQNVLYRIAVVSYKSINPQKNLIDDFYTFLKKTTNPTVDKVIQQFINNPLYKTSIVVPNPMYQFYSR